MAAAPLKQLAEALPSFVKLGFGVANGTAEQPGDFVVLVALHVMQQKHGLVPSRQLCQRVVEFDAIEDAGQAEIRSADLH